MIRRNDMANYETIFKSFEISKEIDFNMKSDLPYPNYTFGYFEKELEAFMDKYLDKLTFEENSTHGKYL